MSPLFPRLLSCIAAFLAGIPAAAAPPPGFETIDQEVTISAAPGTMRFDLERFAVEPGSRVKLIFVNEDSMPHNLVICEPGGNVMEKVGEAVLAMGGDGLARAFVPDVPEVLFHTELVDPGESGTLYFRAPDEEGDYPYICTIPGHWFTMNGMMRVGDAPPEYLSDLTYEYYEGRFQSVHQIDREAPEASGPVPGGEFDFGVHGSEPDDIFGLIFRGQINVEHSGEYTFRTVSDDGIRLEIGGREVVLDDGTHAPREAAGSIRLSSGSHPVELRYFNSANRGVLQVSFSGADSGPISLSPSERSQPQLDYVLTVQDEPRVVRILMPDASSDAIAVGLRDGISYCFDAIDGSVRYGWRGGFLDTGPHLSGRGGKPAAILGDRFGVGHVAFPFRVGQNDEPEVKFLGYRRGEVPEFTYTVDGVPVTQTIEPGPRLSGLTYRFEVAGGAPAPVRFLVDPENLLLSSSAGTWEDGVLTVSPTEARSFTVTIQPAAGQVHSH